MASATSANPISRRSSRSRVDEVSRLCTADGIDLCGCYLKGSGPRRGVILFGLEFGSNRWACVPYCEHLLQNGYDVFAFESRGQGESGQGEKGEYHK